MDSYPIWKDKNRAALLKRVLVLPMLFLLVTGKVLANSLSHSNHSISTSFSFLHVMLLAVLIVLFCIAALFIYLILKRKYGNIILQKGKDAEQRVNELKGMHSKSEQHIRSLKTTIEQQNASLDESYQLIEEYIGKLTDSIRYAERIQSALLPPLEATSKTFSDSFCLYLPKDFVSGDFYWYTERDDNVYFAAADCTGHGVPGAFMSIIGIDMLNQAMNLYPDPNSSTIVSFIGEELRKRLRFDTEESVFKDAMDIALCKFTPSTHTLEYCGALMPLVIVRNKKLNLFKPNSVSLGTNTQHSNISLTDTFIDLQKNDWIYLFSDGFMDQISGEGNKKFMRSRFLEVLVQISEHKGQYQKDELQRVFDNWKGKMAQIDDVLVFGLKI
jgi:serine phosphatase RsbU (regulator of sigma subunit)